jgi:6-phosphogluconolactonase
MKEFNSKDQLDQALCADLVKIIQRAISENGSANILLSGGSSPIRLYELMSNAEISWSKVLIGLVDERFVPPINEFSNEKMIREKLIQNNALSARFAGMVANSLDQIENVNFISSKYQPFMQKVDLVLLGMGEDGHTASLFPNDEVSEQLLRSSEIGIYNTISPNFPNNRITCSAAMLLQADNIVLMLSGEKKLQVFETSAENQLPISFFKDKLQVYYSI